MEIRSVDLPDRVPVRRVEISDFPKCRRLKCQLTFERTAVVFDAFISYSHAADGQLAAALQHGLHRFAKPLFKKRAIRVFRDESTLAMTPQLWPEIEKALRSSRFFILMGDPLSAQSEWVKREL